MILTTQEVDYIFELFKNIEPDSINDNQYILPLIFTLRRKELELTILSAEVERARSAEQIYKDQMFQSDDRAEIRLQELNRERNKVRQTLLVQEEKANVKILELEREIERWKQISLNNENAAIEARSFYSKLVENAFYKGVRIDEDYVESSEELQKIFDDWFEVQKKEKQDENC